MFSLVSLSACGGGGGGVTPPPPSVSVSGVAATGAAINGGRIALRDAAGNTKTVVTDSSGNYSVDITGLTGPFLLRVHPAAGADLFTYASGSGIANIHPFTDLIVRNRFALSGHDNTDALFAMSSAIDLPTSAQINAVKDNVTILINDQLVAAGINPSNFDFLTTSFTPGSHSLFDNVLDTFKVIISSAGSVTIENSNGSLIASFSLNSPIPSNGGSSAPVSPLFGTWHSSLISSGTNPEWCRSRLSVDYLGKFTMLENLCSDGDTSLSVAFDGMVTGTGEVTFPAFPSYHGYMSQSGDLVFMTSTSTNGSDNTYQFNVFNKLDNPVSFSTADLTGTWNIHALTSGGNPQRGAWAYATIGIDNSGVGTWTSVTRSNGNSSLPSSSTLSITSSGVVSEVGEAFQGVMSKDKRMIVATMTESGGYDLIIYQKVGGAVFTSSDLEGPWKMHMLVSGDNTQGVGWAHGTFDINSSGVATWTSMTRSNGNASLPSGKFSITSSGVVSEEGKVSFQGVMFADKQTIFATMTENGYELLVFQK
jgi:hypothetical protein